MHKVKGLKDSDRFMPYLQGIFICLIYLMGLLPLCLQAEHPNIKCIDKKDQETLETFFEYVIHRTSIGYSLCSQKPLATETFIEISKISKHHVHHVPKILFEHYGYSILWNGWKCWERYSHLFPSEKFVFRFIPSLNTLVLINKPGCRNVIDENIDLFQKYLGITLTSEEIFEKICFPINEEHLFKNNCLLGILYGFGRNNSLAFSNRCYFLKLETFAKTDVFNPFLGYGFITINNGRNEKENKKVKKMFDEAQKKIHFHFTQKNNFETFLKLYVN